MKFAAFTLIVSSCVTVAIASETAPGKVPPIAPKVNEVLIAAVPVWSIHEQLKQCMKDAAATLTGNAAIGVRVAAAHAFFSPDAGYVLRADFRRDDVSPPLVNRIVCWQNGQLIVSRISAPPLRSIDAERPLAVPEPYRPRQN